MRILLKMFVLGSLAFNANSARAEDESDEVPMTHEESEVLMDNCLKEDAQACCDYAFYAAKVKKNFATYRLALKRACSLKNIEACEQVEKDDKEGEEYRKKCEEGDVESCVMYSTGRAMMYEDLIGAIRYASKACKLGHKISCEKVKAEQDKVLDGHESKIKKGSTNEQ
jgi:hypothetical protein